MALPVTAARDLEEYFLTAYPTNLAEAVLALHQNPGLSQKAKSLRQGAIRAGARIILGKCARADVTATELASVSTLNPAALMNLGKIAEEMAPIDARKNIASGLSRFRTALRMAGVYVPNGRGAPAPLPAYAALLNRVSNNHRAAVREFLGACNAANFNRLSDVPADLLIDHCARLSTREPTKRTNTKARKIIAFWDKLRTDESALGLGPLYLPSDIAARGSRALTPSHLVTEFDAVIKARFYAHGEADCSKITISNAETQLHALVLAYKELCGDFPNGLIDLVRDDVWRNIIDRAIDRSHQIEGERYHPLAYATATVLLELAMTFDGKNDKLVRNIIKRRQQYTNSRADIEPSFRRKLILLADRKTCKDFINAPFLALAAEIPPEQLEANRYERQFLLAWAIMFAVPMWAGVLHAATFGPGGTFCREATGIVRAQFGSQGRNILPRRFVLETKIADELHRFVSAEQSCNEPIYIFKDRFGAPIGCREFRAGLRECVSKFATKIHPGLTFGATQLRSVVAFIHLYMNNTSPEDVRRILGATHSNHFDLLERFVEQLRNSSTFDGWSP